MNSKLECCAVQCLCKSVEWVINSWGYTVQLGNCILYADKKQYFLVTKSTHQYIQDNIINHERMWSAAETTYTSVTIGDMVGSNLNLFTLGVLKTSALLHGVTESTRSNSCIEMVSESISRGAYWCILNWCTVKRDVFGCKYFKLKLRCNIKTQY